MDFVLNDTSSLRLELQDCGGLESNAMLRIYQNNDNQCYYSGNPDGPRIFPNENDCGKIMICKELDTVSGKLFCLQAAGQCVVFL